MRITFDAEADAVYISLVPEIEPGRSVRNVEIESTGGSVVLGFPSAGVVLGVEVLGATKLLDATLLASAVRIDS